MLNTTVTADPSSVQTTSVVDRAFNRISTALNALANTIEETEERFAPALTSSVDVTKQTANDLREVSQSVLHEGLLKTLQGIETQIERLNTINSRSTL